MKMVRPKVQAPQVSIAEEQDEYLTLTAALVLHPQYPSVATEHGPLNGILLAFRPNMDERARLLSGEDLYISLLTFLQPMPGINVMVGARAASAIFNVPEEV